MGQCASACRRVAPRRRGPRRRLWQRRRRAAKVACRVTATVPQTTGAVRTSRPHRGQTQRRTRESSPHYCASFSKKTFVSSSVSGRIPRACRQRPGATGDSTARTVRGLRVRRGSRFAAAGASQRRAQCRGGRERGRTAVKEWAPSDEVTIKRDGEWYCAHLAGMRRRRRRNTKKQEISARIGSCCACSASRHAALRN